MIQPQRLLAVPLALAAMVATASASEIRDRAGMFSEEAVRKATTILDRAEQKTRIPTIIETVPSLRGETIGDASLERARESGIRGVYVLISKGDGKIMARDAGDFLGAGRRKQIEGAFTENFSRGKSGMDAGLIRGAETIAEKIAEAPPRRGTNARPAPGQPGRAPAQPPGRAGGGGGIGSGLFPLLLIGGVILGVVFLIRLFSRASNPGYGPGGPGGPGPMQGGPGYGPGGYGAPGYGGRGGGFLSGMLGGLGGALAGNWLYDRFSGRHHDPGVHYPDQTSGAPGPDPGATDWGGNPGGSSWTEPPDAGGGSDWGGGTGGDWGGGGGDVAGGGDWGGGGGDWGGGDGGEWT